MGLTHLLDTDTCIYAMNRRSPALLDRLVLHDGRLGMSSITLAELLFGAEKSSRVADNLSAVYLFSKVVPPVDFDPKAAAHYGQIKSALFGAGTPIGANDMLIAAHARSLDLTLVTNNRREFDRIPGLKVENWV